MPCYYTGSREGDLELNLEESHKVVTKLTRLLCEACKKIPEKDMSKKLRKWCKQHKKIDNSKET